MRGLGFTRINRVRTGVGCAGVLCIASSLHAACPDQTEFRARIEQVQGSKVEEPAKLETAWRPLIATAQACGDHAMQSLALKGWSDASMQRGDVDASFAADNERFALAAQHGLGLDQAEAAARLAPVLAVRGEGDLARKRFQQASELYEQNGDLRGAADAYTALSGYQRKMGDYLGALRNSLESLELRRQLAPPAGIWRTQLNIAVLFEQIELFDEARRRFVEALAEVQSEGDAIDVADVQSQFAGFLNDSDKTDAPQALALATQALSVRRSVGNPAHVGSSLLQVARAQLTLGHFDLAEAAFVEAEQLARQSELRGLQAHVDFRYGQALFDRGDREHGLALILRAKSEYEQQGNRHRLIKVFAALEQIYEKLDKPLASAQAGREHYRLRNELLGTGASGQFGDLLTNVALAEAHTRNVTLAQRNELDAALLQSARQQRLALVALAGVAALVLVVLAWRHSSMRRLYRLLSEKAQLIEHQGTELARSNQALTLRSEELLRASQTDHLTGLRNRAFGMAQLAEVLKNYRSRGERPALLMIDIDHFKSINDRFGHHAGDQVLISTADCMRRQLPENVEISRVGGEEFMVVLPHAAASEATLLADALRRHVRELRVDVGPQVLKVTISVGVCVVGEGEPPSLQDFYSRADRALYRAKTDGRDCIRLAS